MCTANAFIPLCVLMKITQWLKNLLRGAITTGKNEMAQDEITALTVVGTLSGNIDVRRLHCGGEHLRGTHPEEDQFTAVCVR